MPLFLVVLSLLLYFVAPMSYSWAYCAICAGVYIVSSILGLIPTIRKEPLSFSLFFSLAVFICTFVFPLFVYPLEHSFSLFSFGYDPNVISKSSAMVTLAHSVYWLGVKNATNKYYSHFIVDNIIIEDKTIEAFTKLVFVMFIGFIALGGMTYYTNRYLDSIMSTNMSFQYWNLIFTVISVALACMLLYANKTKTYLRACIVLGIITVVILSTGSRTLPMYILLPMVYVYQRRYNVTILRMLAICMLLLFVFVAIGQLRHDVITVKSLTSFNAASSNLGYLDNMTDFIVSSRDLYDIYSYVENNGILWGKNFLSSLLSVIPFAQGFVSVVFGIPSYQMDSAYFCTYQVFGSQPPLGLGTHVVGDVYLATGLIGVIFMFYFLGVFVTKLKNGAVVSGNNFMYISYLYILSYSVFFCRGSFFGAVKGILWTAVALYLINRNVYNRRRI